jgi:hypothetical protein
MVNNKIINSISLVAGMLTMVWSITVFFTKIVMGEINIYIAPLWVGWIFTIMLFLLGAIMIVLPLAYQSRRK